MKKKAKHGGRRLNRKIAQQIRDFALENPEAPQAEIGIMWGVSREAINQIINNKTYKK